MERSEVEEIARIVEEKMKLRFREDVRDKLEITLCGSYRRRQKQTCGDADVLIVHQDYVDRVPPRALGELVEDLYEQGHIAYHLTNIPGMRDRGEEEDEDPVLSQGGYSQNPSFHKEKKDKFTVSSYMGVFNSPHGEGKRRRVDIKVSFFLWMLPTLSCSWFNHTSAHPPP